MSEIDWFQLCVGCNQEKWRHAAGMVSWCSGFQHEPIEPGSTDILDARWCADGVARWDPRIDAHFNMYEGQRERFQNFEGPGHWEWQTREEFEKLFQGDWDPRRSYSTYAEPNHRQQEEELEKLVRFLQTSQLFDEEFMRVMRRRYGIDKDPPG